MLFSQRYFQAIKQGYMAIELSSDVRKKLWIWLSEFNDSVQIQRDHNDNWISNSSVLSEVEKELRMEHGWEGSINEMSNESYKFGSNLRSLVIDGEGHLVFDVIELAYNWTDRKERFRLKVNQVLELHECPWHLSDGEFFKLDRDFIGAKLATTAHDALAAHHFTGAANEYAKSRQELVSGEVKDAIVHASKSFESILKVITGLRRGNARSLIKEMLNQGYFDDLPDNAREGFANHAMMALPFLRNHLGAHGQGAHVVTVPVVYGEFAIQLAAALHNFLIAKHLQRPTRLDQSTPDVPSLDEDIPF